VELRDGLTLRRQASRDDLGEAQGRLKRTGATFDGLVAQRGQAEARRRGLL
jgi:hypothetical protein